MLIGAVEVNIDSIFQDGTKSIWKILAFFAAVSAVYPKVGFIKRHLDISKDWQDIRPEVVEYMSERGYGLESESDGAATFRLKGLYTRVPKMFEDRITITWTAEGYMMEGLRKDVIRFATGLENSLSV